MGIKKTKSLLRYYCVRRFNGRFYHAEITFNYITLNCCIPHVHQDANHNPSNKTQAGKIAVLVEEEEEDVLVYY